MKTKNIFLLILGLLFSGLTQAQQAELNTAPPAQAVAVDKPTGEAETGALKATPPALPRKIQYSLSAGTMFSNGFGGASYVQPRVLFPVTNRFLAFGGISIVNTFATGFGRNVLENAFPGSAHTSSINYIVNAGGQYLVNDRLSLTGSMWRDLSKRNYLPNIPLNVFGPNGTSGMQFKAHYKLTENLSVSGGVRYSNGNRFNPVYQQGFSPDGF